jgi:hypothetical protein
VPTLHYSGSRATASISSGDSSAHLFAQSRTVRIRQLHGLDFAIGSSISPLRASAILSNSGLIFMSFRGLKALRGQLRKLSKLERRP